MQGEIREKPDSKGFRLPDPYKFHPQLRVFGAPSDVPNLVQGDTPRLDDVKSKRAYPGHLFKLLDTGLVTPSFINASDKKAQEITDKARVGADKSRKSSHARRTPPNRRPPPTPAPSPEQDSQETKVGILIFSVIPFTASILNPNFLAAIPAPIKF